MALIAIFIAALLANPSTIIGQPGDEITSDPPDPPTITYMYRYEDAYLRHILNEELSLNIEFVQVPREKEGVPIAAATLPDVLSLTSLSPREQFDNGVTRSLPETLIRLHMPGYTRILNDSNEWHRLRTDKDSETQLALSGYLHDRQFYVYSLAVRRELIPHVLQKDPGSYISSNVPHLRPYAWPNNRITLTEIETILNSMRDSDSPHYYWAGTVYHLSPIFAYFEVPIVAGSALFGYDINFVPNLYTSELREFFGSMREWHSADYFHSSFLNGETYPRNNSEEIGMMTVNLGEIGLTLFVDGERDDPVSPLKWSAEEQQYDIVIIEAQNVLSRAYKTPFLSNPHSPHANETVNARVEKDDRLAEVLKIFELVRVLYHPPDHPPGQPRRQYWVEWVFGEDEVHYTKRDNSYVQRTNKEVLDRAEVYGEDNARLKWLASFLGDRPADDPAGYHFKIPPLFRTELAASELYDNAFLRYMNAVGGSWTDLPVMFRPDPCNVRSGIAEKGLSTDERSLIASIIRGELEFDKVVDDYGSLIDDILNDCD